MTSAIRMQVTQPTLGFSAAESVASRRVDRESRIIYGVAVITEGVAKGHGMLVDSITLSTVLACAKTYAEGLKVKEDHGSGVMAAVGILKNLRIDGSSLRGDLHIMRSYDEAERLFEMAETMPSTFGLSISFSGTAEQIDGNQFARCHEIYSADLVSEPAANPNGLFSVTQTQFKTMTEDQIKTAIDAAIDSKLATIGEDYAAKFTAIEEKLAKLGTDEAAEEEQMEEHTEEKKDEEMSALSAQIKELRTLVTEFAKHGAKPANVKPAATDMQAEPDHAQRYADAVKAKRAELPASRKADAFAIVARSDPEGYKAFSMAGRKGIKFDL
jgi:hypothetical protein